MSGKCDVDVRILYVDVAPSKCNTLHPLYSARMCQVCLGSLTAPRTLLFSPRFLLCAERHDWSAQPLCPQHANVKLGHVC